MDEPDEIRPDERFDEARLEAHLRAAIPGLSGPMSVRQFRGGHANLTYSVAFGDRELVLRRPPLGPVAPKSHDMAREFRALRALNPVYSPAPTVLHLCEDTSVIGAIFFVMERRRGLVIRMEWPSAEYGDAPEARARVAGALVDALADLHLVDTSRPEIAALGKPQGFVQRQVSGWHERWQRAKTREMPLMDRLADRLAACIPVSRHVAVLHNDYKLDNAMFDPADPGKLVAVFDWDMATLGDPLVDLGTLLGYWGQDGDDVARGTGTMVTMLPGFLTREQVAQRYARRTGFDVGHLAFYETFALFKTAVVLEQIYVRFVRGQTRDDRFALLGPHVPRLAEAAWEAASRL